MQGKHPSGTLCYPYRQGVGGRVQELTPMLPRPFPVRHDLKTTHQLVLSENQSVSS